MRGKRCESKLLKNSQRGRGLRQPTIDSGCSHRVFFGAVGNPLESEKEGSPDRGSDSLLIRFGLFARTSCLSSRCFQAEPRQASPASWHFSATKSWKMKLSKWNPQAEAPKRAPNCYGAFMRTDDVFPSTEATLLRAR